MAFFWREDVTTRWNRILAPRRPWGPSCVGRFGPQWAKLRHGFAMLETTPIKRTGGVKEIVFLVTVTLDDDDCLETSVVI